MTFTALKKDSAFKRLRKPKLKIATPPRPKAPDNTNTEYDRIYRILKDEKLTKQCMKNMQEFRSTLPEAITYIWLERKGQKFFFQLEMFGGRRRSGGIIADFVVPVRASDAYIWAVQGNWWHRQIDRMMADERANTLPLGQVFYGYRIIKVIELWEDDIYFKRPQCFLMANAGIEMRS